MCFPNAALCKGNACAARVAAKAGSTVVVCAGPGLFQVLNTCDISVVWVREPIMPESDVRSLILLGLGLYMS